MNIVEYLSICNDNQISHLLKDRFIEIELMEGSLIDGAVVNFLGASYADDTDRTIIGLILDDGKELCISSQIIRTISIY